MKIIVSVAVLLGLICIIYFGGDLLKTSKEAMLPDMNPELVAYLQGQWKDVNNDRHIMLINRNSITEIVGDSLKTGYLEYRFNEPASKYYTKDSAFDFSGSPKTVPPSQEFVLKEIDNEHRVTMSRYLVYCSLTRLDLSANGKLFQLKRAD